MLTSSTHTGIMLGDMGEKKKENLDHRHMIRTSRDLVAKWRAHATRKGFPNVSAWIRKTLADAMQRS